MTSADVTPVERDATASREPRRPVSEAEQLVTVVITTCDRPTDVARALRSALAQTHQQVEIIVVDDGSTDRFDPSTVREASLTDRHVRVLATSGREGANRARNLGLKAARGSWITFLDDDDELLPDMIARSLRSAVTSALPHPVAVVSGIREYEDGAETLTRVPRSRVLGGAYRIDAEDHEHPGMAAFNTLVLPTTVMRQIGGFDEDIRAAMHTDLFLRVNAVCSIQALSDVTYHMYHHSSYRLSTQALKRAEGMLHTWRKHRATFQRFPRREATHISTIGVYLLRGGRWRQAFSLCGRALLRYPTAPRVARNMLCALVGPRVYQALARYGNGRSKGRRHG